MFGLFMTADGTTLLAERKGGLPRSAEITFGPLTEARLISSDDPAVLPHLNSILRDLEESRFAVL